MSLTDDEMKEVCIYAMAIAASGVVMDTVAPDTAAGYAKGVFDTAEAHGPFRHEELVND